MKFLSLILLALIASGCSSLPTAEETTWQALNIIDAGQTDTIARSPNRFDEIDPLSRRVGGAHPAQASAYLILAAYAAAHFGTFEWLNSKAEANPGTGWGKWLQAFEVVTLAQKTNYVVANAHMGIRPWTSCSAGQCR